MRAAVVSLAVIALAGASPPALAHHVFPRLYETTPITLNGTVSAIEWVNPHVWVHLTVAEPGKAPVNWMVGGGTPNTLLRNGLSKENLAAGTMVTIKAYPAVDSRCLPAVIDQQPTCKADADEITVAGKLLHMGRQGVGAPWESPGSPITYGPNAAGLTIAPDVLLKLTPPAGRAP